jgi:hypothetical protein
MVNYREQLLCGRRIAILGGREDLGDIAHASDPIALRSNVEERDGQDSAFRGR